MADILQSVRGYMLNKTTITSVVSQRIYFVRRPQKSSVPSVTLFKSSEDHSHKLSARSGIVWTRIQVECFSTLYVTSAALAEAICKCGIDTLRGVTGDVDIRGVQVEDGRRDYTIDDPEGGDDHIYVSQFDLRVCYSES